MNTELKKQAKNAFERQFLEDMNNCVFGKNYGEHKKTQNF